MNNYITYLDRFNNYFIIMMISTNLFVDYQLFASTCGIVKGGFLIILRDGISMGKR